MAAYRQRPVKPVAADINSNWSLVERGSGISKRLSPGPSTAVMDVCIKYCFSLVFI